jgi:hypothetical protein
LAKASLLTFVIAVDFVEGDGGGTTGAEPRPEADSPESDRMGSTKYDKATYSDLVRLDLFVLWHIGFDILVFRVISKSLLFFNI